MKTTTHFRQVLAAVLTIAALAVGQSAFSWTLTNSGNVFTITRNNSTTKTTVTYRTVSITALAGKHFTPKTGTLTFEVGETSKQVTVTETPWGSVPLRYRYQGFNYLYYALELLDFDGSRLNSQSREIYTGSTTNNPYYLATSIYCDYVSSTVPYKYLYLCDGSVNGLTARYHDTYYTPPTSDVETSGTLNGYVLIDDSYDYSRKSATVTPDWLFGTGHAGATGEWHKLVGNKLYASVCFTEKEKDDGYAYVQILIGDGNTAYDEGYDPNGSVNTPVKSIYKACFELKKGSGVYSGAGKWIFPHIYDVHNRSEETSQYSLSASESAFYMDDSYLWEQKFRSEDYRATGYLNNAFVLDPDIGALTVRFDCGGSNDDTYGYKDLFVRWLLVDTQAPTVLKDDITISPGLHAPSNHISISIPFSEPIRLSEGTHYTLHTSWGDFDANPNCDATNVVTFDGSITAETGTALTINSISTSRESGYGSSWEIRPITDIIGNEFGGNVAKTLSVTVDGVYTITYDLGGGTGGDNPTGYTSSSPSFTLINPTREHYIFTGWTGTGLTEPTMTVTIPAGSTGDRSYTANWQLDLSGLGTGDGSEEYPYIITTTEQLDYLAILVNDGNNFADTYFELGADLDFEDATFRGIGTGSNKFNGNFDGKGHSVSNFTVNADGMNYSGLFRFVAGGYIKNVTVRNATINGIRYVGAIAGTNEADITGCRVEGCTVTGNASVPSNVGGITGYAESANLTDCVVSNCTISSTSTANVNVGGIVGYINLQTAANCVVSGCDISGTGGSRTWVGPVAGIIYYSRAQNCFVLNSTSSGSNTVYGGYTTYYTNPAVNDHYHALTLGTGDTVSDVFTVTTGSDVTVTGTPTVSYDGVDYYLADATVTLGYTGGSETLTLPAADVTALLNGYTNADVITAAEDETRTVVLTNRTLFKDGSWNTLCLPFDLDLEGSPLEGAVAKTLDVQNTTMTGTHVHLVFSEPVTWLWAGTPYIIKWDSGDDIVNPVFADVEITAPVAQTLTSTDGFTRFIGYYDAFGIDATNSNIYYMTADNTLKHTAKPRTLKGFRAYFRFFPNENSGVKPLTFDIDFGDDEATSIHDMDEVLSTKYNEVYDLSGRRVSTPTKGLYIINGKKVFIK